jgi:hypothetical protein
MPNLNGKLLLMAIAIMLLFTYLVFHFDSKLNGLYKNWPANDDDVTVKNSNRPAYVEKIIDFHQSLLKSEKKIYSQFGEDGIIQRLIEFVNIPKRNGYYVE